MPIIKRKMLDVLDTWNSAGHEKAFLLVGARQTGKTFIVRQFAKTCFKNIAEVNLIEQPDAAAVLSAAQDVDDFVSRLSLLTGAQLKQEKTLLFLDEIQAAPQLITMVKFIVDSGRFPIVLSGSMLGTELKGSQSFPVGYVQIERMFPLDFEEFCWAMGTALEILDGIRESYASRRPLDDALHEKLMSMFRHFVAVGGMPEAVSAYIDASHDLGTSRLVAQSIVRQYEFDISKYNEKRASQIRSVYNAVPMQLDKVNKRFRFDALKDGATYDRYSNDFDWLIDAAVVLPTYMVAEPKRPLQRTAQMNKFKLYESDTGLLLSQYDPRITLDVINNESSVNFGAVYENAVAQALCCQNPDLYYFFNSRKGEVDFLVTMNDGRVVPLEIKSGKDYKFHSALNNLLGTDEYGIDEAYVLSGANVERTERSGKTVWYLPLYMSFCIAEQADGNLHGASVKPPVL